MLLLRSIFFTFLFPGTMTVVIPLVIVVSGNQTHLFWAVRYLGLPLIVIGGVGLLWSIWQFFSEGRGTLAPVDPPKQLVVKGLYLYVRNPMYASVMSVLIGEAILFGSFGIIIEAGIFFAVTHSFIVFYEEPFLENQFGLEYENYKRSVGRWFPRKL